MCTVTYLPTQSGFILTSNRDEALVRKPAGVPQIETIAGQKVLFPRDGEAGGAWIASADSGRTVCLLNGAFKRHERKPPYRKSRGLVVLDFFKTESALNFHQQYDLQGIEPFTLVIIEGKELFEFRWDGQSKFFKPLNPAKPHIHCSATLYTPEVIAMREKWFAAWLQRHNEYQVTDILTFHLFAGEGDEHTQVRMSIFGIVQTVSITCIQSVGNKQSMYYSDLKGEKNYYFGKYRFNGDTPQSDMLQGLTIAKKDG
jgi:transport and Golgi organization protein 2